jgi:hypothetical protein
MRRILILLLASATAAVCADDPWTAVIKLKSGTEIRVLKKGSMQPVLGKFDEANGERLLLVVKNEQVAIPKDQVDRVDARNAQPGGRVKVEGKTTTDDPQAAKEPAVGMNAQPVAGTSVTSGVSIGGKPEFETVYRRPMGAPKSVEIKK